MLQWLLAVLGGVVVLGAPLAFWLTIFKYRQRLESLPEKQRWDHAVQTCAANPAFRLGQIVEVLSSDAERGEYARIAWHDTDVEQEIWFGDAWPLEDVWVVVTGANGDGASGHNPKVFYVSEVHDIIVL